MLQLDAYLVRVEPSSIGAFGIDFRPVAARPDQAASEARVKPQVLMGKAKSNFRETTSMLAARKKATLIAAPRITAINYLPGSILQTTATPTVLEDPTNDGLFQDFLVYSMTNVGLTALPVIQPDGSIEMTY